MRHVSLPANSSLVCGAGAGVATVEEPLPIVATMRTAAAIPNVKHVCDLFIHSSTARRLRKRCAILASGDEDVLRPLLNAQFLWNLGDGFSCRPLRSQA